MHLAVESDLVVLNQSLSEQWSKRCKNKFELIVASQATPALHITMCTEAHGSTRYTRTTIFESFDDALADDQLLPTSDWEGKEKMKIAAGRATGPLPPVLELEMGLVLDLPEAKGKTSSLFLMSQAFAYLSDHAAYILHTRRSISRACIKCYNGFSSR